MTTTRRLPLLLVIPPPLLFVLTFLGGVGVQRLLPLPSLPDQVLPLDHLLGEVVMGMGVLLALSCVLIFITVRTTIIPFGSAAKLIDYGPYCLSRNPMYVSLVLVYTGVAALLVQPWSLLLLPLPVAIMHTVVIPFEEGKLREIFGEAFDQYCASVRRWI